MTLYYHGEPVETRRCQLRIPSSAAEQARADEEHAAWREVAERADEAYWSAYAEEVERDLALRGDVPALDLLVDPDDYPFD